MSLEERRTMMNFFVVLASPLAIGDNILAPGFKEEVLPLYTNEEVIAVNQDKLGLPGRKVSDSQPGGLQWVETWAKPLANGDYAVLLFNRGSWGGCEACGESPQGCACM